MKKEYDLHKMKSCRNPYHNKLNNLASPFRQVLVLLLGTFLGGYIAAFVIMGFQFDVSFSGNVTIALIVLGISLLFVLILWPINHFIQSRTSVLMSKIYIALSSVVLALAFGVYFYTVFLPRSLDLALTRDLAGVLAFGLFAVGYCFSLFFNRQISQYSR